MRECIATQDDTLRDMGLGATVIAPRRDSFVASWGPDASYAFKTMEGGLERLGIMAQRINSDLSTHFVSGGVTRREKVPAAPRHRFLRERRPR